MSDTVKVCVDDRKPCKGLLGLLLGHNYEHVFDTEEKDGYFPKIEGSVILDTMSNIIQSAKLHKKTYVHSVCTRCGDVIKVSTTP
jgi:alkyl hydroperoxide reductase subunit AhpF